MEDVTLDHIIPTSNGGDDRLENLQLACLQHNQAKSNMSQEQWDALQRL